MEWLNARTAVAGGCLALVALQGYGWMSVRNNVDERLAAVEREVQSIRMQDEAKLSQLSSNLDVVSQRMGLTAQELKEANALAEKLKQENTQTAQRLRKELAAKADVRAVKQFH